MDYAAVKRASWNLRSACLATEVTDIRVHSTEWTSPEARTLTNGCVCRAVALEKRTPGSNTLQAAAAVSAGTE